MIRAELKTARCLQCIRRPQAMLDPDYRRQLHHDFGKFHPDEIRAGKKQFKHGQCRVVVGLHRAYPAFQPCQAAHRRNQIRVFRRRCCQLLAHLAGERLFALNQVDQCARVKESNHQSRVVLSSTSICAPSEMLTAPTDEASSDAVVFTRIAPVVAIAEVKAILKSMGNQYVKNNTVADHALHHEEEEEHAAHGGHGHH